MHKKLFYSKPYVTVFIDYLERRSPTERILQNDLSGILYHYEEVKEETNLLRRSFGGKSAMQHQHLEKNRRKRRYINQAV